MGIFDSLFGGGESGIKQGDEPELIFGRYSDSYKAPEQYKAWDEAVRLFEEKKYLEAYKEFFFYLKDRYEENVKYAVSNGKIRFEIYQGSKVVYGEATNEHVVATANVVKCDELKVAFMRKLMEINFQLKYGRYGLTDDNNIAIKFDTSTIDGHPNKLYYALKEISTAADKQDDLLEEEFSQLHSIDNFHVQDASEKVKEVRLKYLRKWINDAMEKVNSLDQDKFSGGIAYLLLNSLYKIDYLINPEGKTVMSLERGHRMFFAKDNRTTLEKNKDLKKFVNEIQQRDDDAIKKEIYRVVSTFGVVRGVPHDAIKGLCNEVLENMVWYKENNRTQMAIEVMEYAAGYAFFNYGMPQPDREYFHILFHVLNSDFFDELGYAKLYDESTKKLDKRNIKSRINSVQNRYAKRFPKASLNDSSLNFNDLLSFTESYIKAIADLTY